MRQLMHGDCQHVVAVQRLEIHGNPKLNFIATSSAQTVATRFLNSLVMNGNNSL